MLISSVSADSSSVSDLCSPGDVVVSPVLDTRDFISLLPRSHMYFARSVVKKADSLHVAFMALFREDCAPFEFSCLTPRKLLLYPGTFLSVFYLGGIVHNPYFVPSVTTIPRSRCIFVRFLGFHSYDSICAYFFVKEPTLLNLHYITHSLGGVDVTQVGLRFSSTFPISGRWSSFCRFHCVWLLSVSSYNSFINFMTPNVLHHMTSVVYFSYHKRPPGHDPCSSTFTSPIHVPTDWTYYSGGGTGEFDTSSLKDYKIYSAHVFITIPQYDLNILAFRTYIFSQEPQLDYLLIGTGPHADGGPHCHIYMRFHKRQKLTNKRWTSGFNHTYRLEKPRNARDCISYIRSHKSVVDYSRPDLGLPSLDSSSESVIYNLSKHTKKEDSHRGGLLSLIRSSSVSDLSLSELNGLRKNVSSFDNSTKILSRLEHEVSTVKHSRFGGFTDIHTLHRSDPNYNLLHYVEKRLMLSPHLASRTPHLYLWGETMLGKSTLFHNLGLSVPHYIYPSSGWHSSYSSGSYQFILWDEVSFKGISTEELNRFFAGITVVDLNVNGSVSHKYDNPFIVCTSNNTFIDSFAVRLPQGSATCYPYLFGIVPDCCRQNESDFEVCTCTSHVSITAAFMSRLICYNIIYPLHGFIGNRYQQELYDRSMPDRSALEAAYCTHTPVNWLDESNYSFIPNALPSGSHTDFAAYRLSSGSSIDYYTYKSRQQSDYLWNLYCDYCVGCGIDPSWKNPIMRSQSIGLSDK